MITITLQPHTPQQYNAMIDLLVRLRDEQASSDAQFARMFRDAAAETRAELDAEQAEQAAPAEPEPEQPKVRRTRKSSAPPPEPVEEVNTSQERVEKSAESEQVAPPPPPPEPPAPLDNTVTLVELRAKLAALSRDGKADAVKALLADLGATRLTELAASDYGAAMARAEAL